MDLSDKWGTHSSALFNVELALGQGHTLRGSAEKLGARSMNHPKMREITGWKLQYTEVVRQGGGRATKWDGALAAEHQSVYPPHHGLEGSLSQAISFLRKHLAKGSFQPLAHRSHPLGFLS